MKWLWANDDKDVMVATTTGEHADSGWDDYAERVLRNEGRLVGLENLVKETRESDRKLIEQRSDSLAAELERRAEALLELVTARADAVLALGKEEREADRREVSIMVSEVDKRLVAQTGLLREIYDTAIEQNFSQTNASIHQLELRRRAATEKVEQMVRQWRESDKEARKLFASELDKHLDQLNHNNERMRDFQNNSVTRELWQAEKDAAIHREGLLRDQIIAIDRSLLTMVPIAQADKTHAEMIGRMDATVAAASEVLDNKISVVAEKVADLKSFRDTTTGKSAGYGALAGWAIAILTILISVVVAANTFLN